MIPPRAIEADISIHYTQPATRQLPAASANRGAHFHFPPLFLCRLSPFREPGPGFGLNLFLPSFRHFLLSRLGFFSTYKGNGFLVVALGVWRRNLESVKFPVSVYRYWSYLIFPPFHGENPSPESDGKRGKSPVEKPRGTEIFPPLG